MEHIEIGKQYIQRNGFIQLTYDQLLKVTLTVLDYLVFIFTYKSTKLQVVTYHL